MISYRQDAEREREGKSVRDKDKEDEKKKERKLSNTAIIRGRYRGVTNLERSKSREIAILLKRTVELFAELIVRRKSAEKEG